MVEQLFGSKTRVKLLQLFYSNTNRSFYVREITRKINEQINSVRRELANLLSIGIITSNTNNNRLYYEVNQKYEFFEPLKQIFGEQLEKAESEQKADESVAEESASSHPELKALGRVDLAIYTGQFTKDDKPATDFLIVGDINPTQLGKYVEDLESKEGKEIRYTVLTDSEFNYRRQIKDRFLWDILDSKKQVLIDKIGIN